MSTADALYHRLFSHPLMVQSLVGEFLPLGMVPKPDWARMEQVTARFHASTGERREGDVIWRLPFADGSDVYLYLMMEFQSRSDWWMAVRTQVYQGLLWQQIVTEKSLKTGDRLPPVLLLLLYNGDPRWSSPTDLSDLIALPTDSALWHWQPQARYHLIDMGSLPAAGLAKQDSIAALLFRLEQRQEPAALAALIEDVINWFRLHPGYETLKHLFTELVRQAIASTGAVTLVPDELGEMKGMITTLGETWKREWKAEARNEGLQEGRRQGRRDGRREGLAQTLLRQLERRFGSLSNDVRTRVQESDSESLERWLDRVIDAPTMDTLFDEPSERGN